ncbi:MAG TPA: sugar phosphate isomerase/epimerase family protein [Kineosporiaceae bacterium]|nr:sugar phosphate isomerase/epimerase family protein [Kineosporiaceae bacterium]
MSDVAFGLARLSLNQRTIPRWSLPELVDHCGKAGLGAVGLWREPVLEYGVARTAALVRDAGLRVSSLCRGGFFTSPEQAQWEAAIEDNLRALDEAAALGAECVVLVVGGMAAGSTDLIGARQRVHEALAVLAPAARERGVRLALEPLHPIFCADRAVLSTLRQALELAEAVDGAPGAPTVGVVVDAYHVWWDPDVWSAIAAAGPRILSFQVCDWVLPLTEDVLLARGMMGDGYIDLRALRSAVDSAGYAGDIEVEIFNQALWDSDPEVVLDTVVQRYSAHVL